MHSLKASEGKTYAELGAEITKAKDAKDDAAVTKWTAARTTAMNGSFLRASLFTSVLAFGVSLFAIGTGLVMTLTGWALMAHARGARETVAVEPVRTV